jgi:hypothetical protein
MKCELITIGVRATWAIIEMGRDIVRLSEALESSRAAQPATGSEDITLLARIAWKLRDAGEAVKALGERCESRVFTRCAAAGLDPLDILNPLMESAARPRA